jgi:hypothetical protein
MTPNSLRELEDELRDLAAQHYNAGCCNANFPIAACRRVMSEAAEALPALLDERDALAAEVAGLRDASGWQPIDSAPWPDSPVLVISPEWKDGVPAVAGYAAEYDEWYLWGDGGVLMPKPTHWMPLPAPPVAGGGEEA